MGHEKVPLIFGHLRRDRLLSLEEGHSTEWDGTWMLHSVPDIRGDGQNILTPGTRLKPPLSDRIASLRPARLIYSTDNFVSILGMDYFDPPILKWRKGFWTSPSLRSS